MKKVLVLLIWLFAFLIAGTESDIDLQNYFKKDIAYLSSKECFGRGIARGGIYKAEDYISGELKNIGLNVSKQNVRIKINVPQDDPILVINYDTLRVGYDYIPHPFCPTTDACYKADEVHRVNTEELEKLKDKLNLTSLSGVKRYMIEHAPRQDRNKILLFEENYPIVSRQNKQFPQVTFQVVKDVLPDTIKHIYAYHKTRYTSTLTHNVISMIKGSDMPDSVITLGAHYDHMGAYGDLYYPGANDNGSGVAVLLALARYYAENPPPVTLIFCFFTGEEQGLYGSRKYVRRPVRPLKQNMMMLNLDMIGSGHDGWGAVAAKDYPNEAAIFQTIAEKQEFGKIKLRDNAKNSDHFPFTLARNKAIFFYSSGGKQPYHHPDDILGTMDLDVLEKIMVMVKGYIETKGEK